MSKPMYRAADGSAIGVPGDFLVYVDETGNENLRDKHQPVFGFGLCAAPYETAQSQLIQPWADFKAKHFGGLPIHATKLERADVTDSRSLAAREFFRSNLFFRGAAMVRSNTSFDGRLGSEPGYEIAARMLALRVTSMFRWSASTRIVLIFESCERTNWMADVVFPEMRVFENGVEVPIELCRMGKGDLGLEVADFVAHAVGRRVRAKAGGKPSQFELVDFESVFASVPPKYASYIDADIVSKAGAGPSRG